MTNRTRPRRDVGVALALLGVALLDASVVHAEVPKLLVFLHAAIKQRALESMLASGLSGIDVTAVGRVADFERALKEPPDAILSLPVVLSSYQLTPKLRGYRQGHPDETYVLVGADHTPDPIKLTTVGALDVLGRTGTQRFVRELLGTNPNVERVTKVEDLLPLLQMHRAEAVLLPARLLGDLRASSRLSLYSYELKTRVQLPAVASASARGSSVVTAFNKLPPAVCRSIGVDEWR